MNNKNLISHQYVNNIISLVVGHKYNSIVSQEITCETLGLCLNLQCDYNCTVYHVDQLFHAKTSQYCRCIVEEKFLTLT